MFTKGVRGPARASLLLLSALACNGTTSYLDATGVSGREEASLGRWLTAVALGVVVIVCVALLLAIGRRRGEDAARPDAPDPHRHALRAGLAWIYAGVAVTVVILLATFVGTVVTLDAASRPPQTPTLVMDVTGHQWWWEVRFSQAGHPELGFVTANEMHLPVGIPVRVRLHSADVIHSFWIPQLAGKTDVIPGQVNETWIEATRPGVSQARCAEYCGLQHAFMALSVVAESPSAFIAWTQSRRGSAAPADRFNTAGQMIFMRTCGACHAVEGTMALGRVGPDLTHFASRPSIGAGVFENNALNLTRWIENPQAVKEGARMPAIPLDSAQRLAVVGYLETLR